jgi:hypothetical protein
VQRPDGTVEFTSTIVGTFVTSNGESGNFTNWDGGTGSIDQNGNPTGAAQFGQTLDGRGITAAGQPFTFHSSSHLLLGPTLALKQSFANVHANCG